VDRTVVLLDQVPHDRQAETEASVSASARVVRLRETIEDLGQKLRLDPRPGVSSLDGLGLSSHRRSFYSRSPHESMSGELCSF
jgi:hypothetical protein